jgi:hypothetical protein
MSDGQLGTQSVIGGNFALNTRNMVSSEKCPPNGRLVTFDRQFCAQATHYCRLYIGAQNQHQIDSFRDNSGGIT